MADKVLIVEDSKTFSFILRKTIEKEGFFECELAQSLAEAKELLATGPERFFAALLDINLPDAPRGEVVDLVLERDIPAIVFTSEVSDDLRDMLWAKRIVDYVLKDESSNVRYITTLLARLHRNRDTHVLVVDDSSTSRTHVRNLLKIHRYNVHEAASGAEALEILSAHPDVSLVITDYNMPGMDGFALTRRIRLTHPKERLAVIGYSAQDNSIISARFIKNGANDFIHKPFSSEELYCRVAQNIEMLECLKAVREAADTDHATGMRNRKYFMEVGHKLVENQARGNLSLLVAMLDIDFFKKVNDTHGHAAGDAVLRQLARLLAARFRASDVVARIGGEEFAVIASNMDQAATFEVFDRLRREVAATIIPYEGARIPVTVSIGVCRDRLRSLDEYLIRADRLLYEAKRSGRNRVVVGPPAEPAVL